MESSLSILASIAIIRTSINQFIPQEIRSYIWELSRRFSSDFTIVVKDSHEGSTNHLFNALLTYLGSINAFSATSSSSSSSSLSVPLRFRAGKSESMKVLTYGLDKNSQIVDVFHGVPMKWGYYTDIISSLNSEEKWYELKFHKRHTDMVKNEYLPYIIDMSKRIKDQNRIVKFYTTRGGRDGWSSKGVSLDHPMTFETLAMDGDLKKEIIEDLNSFINGKEYYKKIGKVWKRGYLLYGPPGTGKSSLIAAMANFLNFDIYNLNLSSVTSDSSLEYLLLHMSNRSILVVEDIDCSVMLQNRQATDHLTDHSNQIPRPQVTLSGLLNAIDGLLSCCGDERIIVFTTNYKDRIDPALLRAGRMDMHIYLSYCTFSTFKQLAANYLDIWDHDLFSCIEKQMKDVQVTPADVAGELMKNKDSKISLEWLIKFLEHKKLEAKPMAPSPLELQEPKIKSEQETDNFNENYEKQLQKSCKTTDSGDNLLTNKKDEVTPTTNITISEEKEYTVKAEFQPILVSILSKHGDIAANCTLNSHQCRSSFLEIICGNIKKLQTTELENLTELELKSMLSSLHDLESVRIEIGWLIHKLDEIVQAMPLVEQCVMKEFKCEKIELKASKKDSNAAKLHCFCYKSLVEGII